MPFLEVAGAATAAGKSVLGNAAATALGGVAAAKEVFDYNRENFMEDREQRMKKEFQERKLRVRQAELWREDIRDFVSLTERKMKYYLLVNVLLLGFNVNLWCEGRLAEDTPGWLMMGNQIATAGSFLFLLLTVWLSMHAAVAAQSYKARVLTQLVRLPVPTWAELEACRTYASEFESLQPSQVFRVPFLTGPQERIVDRGAASSSAATVPEVTQAFARQSSTSSSTHAQDVAMQSADAKAKSQVACDPWGLERRGDDIYELGTQSTGEVAKLRHIKIIRQAAVYWRTYDAFARVSMSVGVNQLMLAMSYYILGYVLCQVRCPAAAFAGVICLIGTNEILAQIDLTLPAHQQRLIQILLVFGPGVSCAAAYHWGLEFEESERVAEGLAPLAFLSHAAVLALLTFFFRVTEQRSGAMLPLAFQGVLFLDVFGWNREDVRQEAKENMEAAAAAELAEHKRPGVFVHQVTNDESLSLSSNSNSILNASDQEVLTGPETSRIAGGTTSAQAKAASSTSILSPRHTAQALSYYAAAYMPGDGESISDLSDMENGSNTSDPWPREMAGRPAIAEISFGQDGKPIAMRPDDQAPEGAVQDMRRVPGAPRLWETVSAVDAPAKEFFEPVTFMPPECRARRNLEDLIDNAGALDSVAQMLHGEQDNICTGHDKESPGRMPWIIFRSSAILLCLVWVCAAGVALWKAADMKRGARTWWMKEENDGLESSSEAALLAQHVKDIPGPNVLSLWAAGFSGVSVGQRLQLIPVEWPYHTISPQSLSCDAMGTRLLVTDGLSTFEAKLSSEAPLPLSETEVEARGRSRSHLRSREQLPSATLEHHTVPNVRFHRTTIDCSALRGEDLLDTALSCQREGNGTSTSHSCKAFVLHQRGHRVAVCPMDSSPLSLAQAEIQDYKLPREWLERTDKDSHRRKDEEISWIFVDQACNENSQQAVPDGCASIATSHGRVVQMQQEVSPAGDQWGTQPLVPIDVMDEREQTKDELKQRKVSTRVAGVVRAFNGRYVGVLQPHRMSIRVLDLALSGAQAGALLLPLDSRLLQSAPHRQQKKPEQRHRGDPGNAPPAGKPRDAPPAVKSFCAGGGYVYLLGHGTNPPLWRLPIPNGLRPDGLRADVDVPSHNVNRVRRKSS